MKDQVSVGDKIEIPCNVQPGAFTDEYLVTIETKDGFISGFVDRRHIQRKRSKDYDHFVIGIVKAILDDTFSVTLPGEYLTTNGTVSFPTAALGAGR